MKKILFVSLICLIGHFAHGQFGVSAKYQMNNFNDWNDQFSMMSGSDGKLFESTIEYGVNYWFRLKNKRVEFLPEISYMVAEEMTFNSPDAQAFPNTLTSFGFNTNVQIYPLDFDGDCNCPTWGKDGKVIEKGFYWIINPGLVYYSFESESSSDTATNIAFRAGLGLGLDIGIHKIITLSPFATINRDFGLTAADLNLVAFETSTRNHLNFGLRLMFRPDYAKQNPFYRGG